MKRKLLFCVIALSSVISFASYACMGTHAVSNHDCEEECSGWNQPDVGDQILYNMCVIGAANPHA